MIREIPVEVLNFVPGQALVLDAILFCKCLASALSGSAPGPGGCTNEMLKVCLDDAEVSQLLFLAAQDMARAQIPESAKTFMLATMTALQKKDGGAGGIVTVLFSQVGRQNVGPPVREGGRVHVHHPSSLCPLGHAWDMRSPSFQWTGLGLSTMSCAVP